MLFFFSSVSREQKYALGPGGGPVAVSLIDVKARFGRLNNLLADGSKAWYTGHVLALPDSHYHHGETEKKT
jgi:hypothetical protein